MMEESKRGFGESLLKGTAVIMTVFGIVEIVLFVLVLAGLILANSATVNLFSGGKEIFTASMLLAAAVSELLCGVFGRRCVKTGGGAVTCIVLGLICLALTLASLILMASKADLLTLLTLILCAIAPVVFVLAACKAKGEQNAVDDRYDAV